MVDATPSDSLTFSELRLEPMAEPPVVRGRRTDLQRAGDFVTVSIEECLGSDVDDS
jgi:hypothetical protein